MTIDLARIEPYLLPHVGRFAGQALEVGPEGAQLPAELAELLGPSVARDVAARLAEGLPPGRHPLPAPDDASQQAQAWVREHGGNPFVARGARGFNLTRQVLLRRDNPELAGALAELAKEAA